MGLSHSPSIVTNGLVFCYDMNNVQKSWKGKPTTNLQLPNVIDWSNSATVTLLAELSPIGTPVYSVTDNNSGSYLASTRSITVPNDSNTYTISIYIKKTYGATSTRLGFNSGFSGGTTVAYSQRFNSDTGVGTYGSTVDLGNWWRWQFQITNNNTGNTTLYCSFYPATGFYDSGDNSAATGTAIVSSVQIEQNTFATPFVNGSRSNTQAILDLTNNNTITATSLTYNSDATFSFDGTNDQITTTPISLTDYTFELFVKATGDSLSGSTGYNTLLGYTGTRRLLYDTSGNLLAQVGSGNIYSNRICTRNVWNHVAFTYQSSNITATWYINGSNAGSSSSAAQGTWNSAIYIGSYNSVNYWMNGSIANVKIYNRALSAAEVSQNFAAHRGRYGI